MIKQEVKGYLLIGLSAIIFGFQGVLSQVLLNFGIPSINLAFFKTFFGLICIGFLMVVFKVKAFTIEKSDIIPFILYGVIGVGLFSYFIFATIQRTNVTMAITLMYTSSAFTILLASIFLKEKITRNKVISVLMTFTGIVLVVVGYNVHEIIFDPLGIVFGLLIGLSHAFYNVNSKKFVHKYNTWVANFYSVLFATVFLAILQNPITAIGQVPKEAWGPIVLLSFMTYGLAHTLVIQGFKSVEAGKGVIVANIEPLVSVALASIFFKESMGLIQAMGFVFVVLAILLTTRKE